MRPETAHPEAATILVVAPMPAHPTSAGNRRRLALTCDALTRAGFAIDLAYFAHEDQIYRRYGQHPPTDLPAMAQAFQRTFLIEAQAAIPLKSRSGGFRIDDWCQPALGDFVAWYFANHPGTGAILVNYVFLSQCLSRVPPGILKLIDTHDRFADRQLQYKPFRAEPNFFYTDRRNEAAGLDRADVVLAIQSEEAAYFAGSTRRRIHLLPPRFLTERPFTAPRRIAHIGFIGHGNDPNLFSIGKFAHAWATGWRPGLPELLVAGEICNALAGFKEPGVRLLGYVEKLEDFYAGVDVVVAPMLMGSGLKMKVAEALAFGVPVVGTPIGFEGFDPQVAAHRCAGVGEIKATILALRDDAVGLAALTRACEALLDRYNTGALAAESALADLIRDAVPNGPPHAEHGRTRAEAPAPAPAPRRAEQVLGTVKTLGTLDTRILRLTCVSRLAATTLDDPSFGRLVATERLGDDAARAIGYAPERRHWFARVSSGAKSSEEKSTGTCPADLDPSRRHLALSPEWVRDRTLPRAVREALAAAFSAVAPDWTTQGRRIGGRDRSVAVALVLPSFLLSGSRPVAAFHVTADGGHAEEWTLSRLAPLHLSPGLTVSAARSDLTPVPALATFHRPGTPALSMEGTLLFLTDDLIGRVDLLPGDAPEPRA